MKRTKVILLEILFCYVGMLFLGCFVTAAAENGPWDCPRCGRTGNTGNYCGGCAHPAPWRKEAFQTVGNIVRFGHYEQDNKTENGKEDIEWLVLDYDEKDNRSLLLSWYGLDIQQYNKTEKSITWEECTLRTWLNSTFLNKAFTTEEQTRILLTNVDNGSSQGYSAWSTNGGNNTKDKIFLLSYSEANKYLGVMLVDNNNMKSRVAPTAYAMYAGAWTSSSEKTAEGSAAGCWWLRSPGNAQRYATLVGTGGSLGTGSVAFPSVCVRPALWINLEPEIF